MAGTSFTPVYLVIGEDELMRETTRKRLIARFRTMGDLDFNMDIFSGDKTDAAEIISACVTVPFLSPYRLVIVENADKLGSDNNHALADYCSAPVDTTVLCLIAPSLATNTVLYKRIAKLYPSSIIKCDPKTKREMPALVRNMAGVYGVRIDNAASALLLEMVGENTIQLDRELSKLALMVGKGKTIDENVVAQGVTRITQPKPWDLTNALSQRDARAIEKVFAQIDTSAPFGLMTMCTTRIRDLITTLCLEQRGEIGLLGSYLGRNAWQADNFRMWARCWTAEELRSALGSAAQTEKAMKSGADKTLAFEMWLLGCCRL